PGRGTLMADALRATRLVPGFQAAARVMLVEPNPVLADLQRATLRRAPLSPLWCSDLSEVPAGDATILIANEVLDCFPVFQLEHADDGWRERGVCLDAAGALQFCRLPEIAPLAPPAPAGAGVGAVFEHRDWRELGQALRHRHDQGPLAALLVDYGHAGPALGDTLQAVRGHAYEHALTSPGEADLTAQVDFAGFAHQVTAWGLACDGPITQAELLGGLGIAERGSRLMAANPRQAALIEASIARLMAPGGMGTRFKAIALRSPALPPLAGFPAMDNERLRP
ncbi:MAG: SAM-dependent methyltransferase, partial [Hyphomicrobiaceae bacterium]|nr:SAM-dependent methyltransferase [Hyphomicrobiaceae bacterium]